MRSALQGSRMRSCNHLQSSSYASQASRRDHSRVLRLFAQQQQPQQQQWQQPQQQPGASASDQPESGQQLQLQQISFLQQQVTLLTQLYQQSQQQNAALATQVSALSEQLASFNTQLLQQQQQQLQQLPQLPQLPEQPQQQQPQQQWDDESQVELASGPTSQMQQVDQQQQKQQHGGLSAATAAVDSSDAAADAAAAAAAAPEAPAAAPAAADQFLQPSQGDTPAQLAVAEQQGQQQELEQQQQASSSGVDPYLEAVQYCKAFPRLTGLHAAAGGELTPQHLCATLSRLIPLSRKHTSSSNSSSSSGGEGGQPTPASFALLLLQQLLEHPNLWQQQQEQQQQQQLVLSDSEVQQLLVDAAAVLDTPLPTDLQQKMQAVVSSCTFSSSSSSGGWEAVQVCKLTGSCLVLGLRPPPSAVLLLRQLTAAEVEACKDTFACASLVLAAATAAPASIPSAAAGVASDGTTSTAQQQQQQQPSTMLESPAVLSAALRRLAGANLNTYLGAARTLQMVLQPLTVLQQLKQQRRLPAAVLLLGDGDVADGVQKVCRTVQRYITTDLKQQQQQQQPQQREGQGRGRGAGRGQQRGRAFSSSGSNDGSSGGCWSIAQAASALLLMAQQLSVPAHPAAAYAFANAAASKLHELPTGTLLPLIHMIGAAAAADQATNAKAAEAAAEAPAAAAAAAAAATAATAATAAAQPWMYFYRRWRWGVINYLGSGGDTSITASIPSLLGVVLTLAQQAVAEESSSSSSSASDVSVTDSSRSFSRASNLEKFLGACEGVIAASVQAYSLGGKSSDSLAQDAAAVLEALPQMSAVGLQPDIVTATKLLSIVAASAQQQQSPDMAAAALAAAQQLQQQPDAAVLAQLRKLLPQQQQQSIAAPGTSTPQPPAAAAAAVACRQAVQAMAASAATAAPDSSQLGAAVFGVYSSIASLSADQLAGFISDLGVLKPQPSSPLSPRVSEPQGKVTYGQVVAAAAAAVAAASKLQELSPAATVQLLAGMAHLGAAPEREWVAAVLSMLAAGPGLQQLSQQELLLLLDALQAYSPAARAAPEVAAVLQQAADALLVQHQQQQQQQTDAAAGGSTLQSMLQQSAAVHSGFIHATARLSQLGATLNSKHIQQLQTALDQCLALPENTFQQLGGIAASSSSSSSSVQLDVLLSEAVEVLGRSGVQQVSSSWLSGLAAEVKRLLPAASGSSCCRLAAGLAALGIERETSLVAVFTKQIESKVTSSSAADLARALPALILLGGSPTNSLANTLVIKTQQQLLSPSSPPPSQPAAAAAAAAGGESSDEGLMMIAGVPTADFAAACWAAAAANLKLPAAWQAAAVRQLSAAATAATAATAAAAAAAQPPMAALYHTAFAAVAWGIQPSPRALLQALKGLNEQQQQLLQVLIERDRNRKVVQQLQQYLPTPHQQQQQQQQEEEQKEAGRPAEATAASAADTASGAAAAVQLLKLVNKAAAQVPAAAGTVSPRSSLQLDVLLLQQLVQGINSSLQGGEGDPAVLLGLEPTKCAQLLRGLAKLDTYYQQQQQQQQEGLSETAEAAVPSSSSLLLSVDGMQSLLAAEAAYVQSDPASTARAAADGPTTLAALVQLQLSVDSNWLSHLTADLDSAAQRGPSSKASNWFRSAAASDILGYLAALEELGQVPSITQCEVLFNTLSQPNKLQQLQVQQIAELLVRLTAAAAAQAGGALEEAAAASTSSSSSGAASVQQGLRYSQLLEQLQAVFKASLPPVLLSFQQQQQQQQQQGGSVLPVTVATELLNALAWLSPSLEDVGLAGGSSSSGSSRRASGAAAGSKASRPKGSSSSNAAAASAGDGAGGRSTVDDLQQGCVQLLEVTLAAIAAGKPAAATPEAKAGDRAQHLLSALWLLDVLPADIVPQQLQQQAAAIVESHIAQQEVTMCPGDAAQFFLHATSLALALNADLAKHDVIPEPGLGGVLVQLQQDIEADWEHHSITSSQMAQLPQRMMKFKLEPQKPDAYVTAVAAQLKAMSAQPSTIVAAAAKRGCGPVELLYAVCWLLMENEPGQAGDTTLSGLDKFVKVRDSTATSSSDGSGDSSDNAISSAAESSVTMSPKDAQILRDMFAAAAAAARAILSSLSGPQLVDLVHVFYMADLPEVLGSQIWKEVFGRLASPQDLAGLKPSQELALLCVMLRVQQLALAGQQEQLAGATVMIVSSILTACQPHLPAWHPASIAFGLFTLGDFLAGDPARFPPKTQAIMTAWQAAAVAALQPQLEQLQPESLVQLLVGCDRIASGLEDGSSSSSTERKDTASGPASSSSGGTTAVEQQQLLLQTVLTAAAMRVSQQLDQLPALQLVYLLVGCSKLETADQQLASEVLSRLQPDLGSLQLGELTGLLMNVARWPQHRQPQIPPEFLDAYLDATSARLAAHSPVTVRPPGSTQQAPQQEDQDTAAAAGTGGADAGDASPAVLSQLAYTLAFMGFVPSPAWRGQLYLVVTGQLQQTEPSDAVTLLQAMSMWQSLSRRQGAPALVGAPGVDYPAPLVDALVCLAGAPESLLRLSPTQRVILPRALKALRWPADQQLVEANLVRVSEYLGQLQGEQGRLEEDMQATQASLARLQNKAASRSKSASIQKLQKDLREDSVHAKAVAGQIEAWETVLGAWEDLHGVQEDVLEGVLDPGMGSAQFQSAQQQQQFVQGSGLDTDDLMAGMLAAAGMAPSVGGPAEEGMWVGAGPFSIDELLQGDYAEGSADDDGEGGDGDADILDAEFEQVADAPQKS